MKRIGIYGGSFNPPHVGHVTAARAAVERLKLDRLLVIPAGHPPHKTPPADSPTAEQRLEMTRLAFFGEPRIGVLDLELKREGPSYTYETVLAIGKAYPDAELVLCMGSDMFASFLDWKNPEVITREASLGVFCRGGREESSVIEGQLVRMEQLGIRVELVENPVVEISSTQLRMLLRLDAAQGHIPEAVLDYIRQNRLYGTNQSLKDLSLSQLEATVTQLFLKPRRVAHVLGCRDTAVALAQRFGEDVDLAARAALLHDVTKALDGPAQLTLCSRYAIMQDKILTQNPKTIHALTGSAAAEVTFGQCQQVTRAIASHTTGSAHMSTLDKIIYLADYIEPNRSFPGVEEVRELAFRDLDQAMIHSLQRTLAHVERSGHTCAPDSLEALKALLNKP